MTRRTLSSAQTFLVKFIYPVVWIPLFGLGVLVLWRHGPARIDFLDFRWTAVLGWLLGSVSLVWHGIPLKKVSRDGEFLYVSNFRREIAVPLSAIDSVTENRWVSTQAVTVRFHVLTEFGDKITFMPVARWFSFIRPHPVVEELSRAASAAAHTPGVQSWRGTS